MSRAFSRIARLLILLITVPAGWTQQVSPVPAAPTANNSPVRSPQPFDVKEYSEPQPYFPNPIGPYTSLHSRPPDLSNTPRMDQLLHDGKLYISIDEAVALALENNLDIAIARYNFNIADTDIWRAKAGSSISGVNVGLVQNTPGGGVGGLGTISGQTGPSGQGGGGGGGGGGQSGGQVGSGQGGTSIAAGGAGAGTGGLVGSTLGQGPQTSSFDPTLTSDLALVYQQTPCNTPICSTTQNTRGANFSYAQGFHWGMDMGVTFSNTRMSTNSIYDALTPSLNSSFQFKVTQHLLQGFGLAVNTRYIEIAKNNREISDVAFRFQVITTVDQIENMYWSLVYAYEYVRVQKQQLEYAQKLLENNKLQVEIGTMAPIEVVRAQSAVASDEQSLTLALTNLELAQLLMKNALSRTLVDPVLADAEVIPTSTLVIPEKEEIAPIEDLVNQALERRPEMAEARINLTNTEISNKAIRNALLPSLDISANYGGAGLGGSQNAQYICLSEPIICGLKHPPMTIPYVSWGDTLNQLVDSSAPTKAVQLSLTIPIRNRAAQATQARSEFEYRQAQLRLQQLENQIRIEVRNAQYGVTQNRASVVSAQIAVELARESLDIEQKKYEIGASTLVLVLQNQAALAQAEGTLLSAQASYDKADVELDRSTGVLLERASIVISDAERGQVTHPPSIPHVTVRPGQIPPNKPAPQP